MGPHDFTYPEYIYTLSPIGDSGLLGTILGFAYIAGWIIAFYIATKN